MAMFTIPEQGDAQYIYTRMMPVLQAAFPEFAAHFAEGRLYIPLTPAVQVQYLPWWHPFPKEQRDFGKQVSQGFPPAPIKWFVLTGYADVDTPDPVRRVRVVNGQVDITALRDKAFTLSIMAKRMRDAYEAQEAAVSVRSLALTPAEYEALSESDRCACGHLALLHSEWCLVPGCRGRCDAATGKPQPAAASEGDPAQVPQENDEIDPETMSVVEASVVLANRKGGLLVTRQALRELIRHGVFQDMHHARDSLYSALRRSKRFAKVRSGVYRLVSQQEALKARPSAPQESLTAIVEQLERAHPAWGPGS